jgi:hypothetical protein
MIALMMFLFLSGAAKKAAPKDVPACQSGYHRDTPNGSCYSQTSDGCNTVTCAQGGGCTSTLVGCVSSGELVSPTYKYTGLGGAGAPEGGDERKPCLGGSTAPNDETWCDASGEKKTRPAAKTIRRGVSDYNDYDYQFDGVKPSPPGLSWTITSADGSKAVMLTDSEYSHLQDLRKAVADEEKRLAVKYGAKPSCWYNITKNSDAYCYDGYDPDHYEYHGQFLLIEKEGR